MRRHRETTQTSQHRTVANAKTRRRGGAKPRNDIAWVQALIEGLHVGAFLIAILLCPAACLVGLVGWIATLIRGRRDSDPVSG